MAERNNTSGRPYTTRPLSESEGQKRLATMPERAKRARARADRSPEYLAKATEYRSLHEAVYEKTKQRLSASGNRFEVPLSRGGITAMLRTIDPSDLADVEALRSKVVLRTWPTTERLQLAKQLICLVEAAILDNDEHAWTRALQARDAFVQKADRRLSICRLIDALIEQVRWDDGKRERLAGDASVKLNKLKVPLARDDVLTFFFGAEISAEDLVDGVLRADNPNRDEAIKTLKDADSWDAGLTRYDPDFHARNTQAALEGHSERFKKVTSGRLLELVRQKPTLGAAGIAAILSLECGAFGDERLSNESDDRAIARFKDSYEQARKKAGAQRPNS